MEKFDLTEYKLLIKIDFDLQFILFFIYCIDLLNRYHVQLWFVLLYFNL